MPRKKTTDTTPATKEERAAKLDKMYTSMLQNMLTLFSPEEIYAEVKPKIEQMLIDEFGAVPQVHKVVLPEVEHKFTGVTHEMFDVILQFVTLKLPVYMEGEAGTGKNEIAKQVAEGLGLDFYFTNAVTQEHKLLGFIDANGIYHETQFYKAFTNGGLFFLDEMDASIPEVLIILNAAIANGYFDFPIGKVIAHENFHVIAAGNTLGTGADNQYTGRYCLDRASLDRFAIVKIGYSPAIEEEVCEHDQELLDFCHAFRTATNKSGIQCVFSYRSLHRIHTLMKTEAFPIEQILTTSLIKDLDTDDIKILTKEVGKILNPANKYFVGLLNITPI